MSTRRMPIVLVALALVTGCTTIKSPDEFRSIFNEIDLTNWEGLPGIWSVEDGAIVGRTTAETNLAHNTFLVWKGDPGEFSDFELRLKYQIEGGNSGIQYRSKLLDPEKFIVGGYQADFESGDKYSGILYEERGRGILALRGQKVTINADGTKQVEQFADTGLLQNSIRQGWNDYTIIARGNHLIHKINGVKMSETIDNQADKAAKAGVLALQVHQGPPMTVKFKDIKIRTVEGGEQERADEGDAKPQVVESAKPAQVVAGGATPAEQIKVLDGFKVELIYSVPKEQQGSWVNLCTEKNGRLIASDQGGKLYRITPPHIKKGGEAKVEPIELEIGQAHGLLYAFDSLYVVVNGKINQGSGLYRVRDTDGDDQYDNVELLRKLEGGGEHGPHAVLLSPDGKSLFIVAGNHTKMTQFDSSRIPANWDEDQLLPRMWDAGGHAVGVLAPGGWIARTDPDGKSWEVFSIGYRNQFDAAFNEAGDLFAYDADMEWDIGSPWYRPTRVNLATSGSEFGWRSGTGKWPAYYPDSLPAIIDIGPGSPTGVAFGYGAKFPGAYQKALFICDWSFGKMYAVHLTPEGAAYEAEAEQFMAAAPLPLTDVVINPKDGAMYFTIGGRGVQSALYRVTYTGGKVARRSARAGSADKKNRDLRLSLEAFHGKQDPKAIDAAWPHLGHRDRFIRYAARIAVEHQPVEQWRSRAVAEQDTQALLTALLALARQGEPADCAEIFEALDRLDYGKLSEAHRLEALRVLGLAMIRMGRPDDSTAAAIVERLDPHYPAKSVDENYELSRVLVYLQSPTAAAKTTKLLKDAPTQEEQVHYALVLRNLTTGWTPELRREYFEWFGKARAFHGGASFPKFLVNIRKEAVANLSESEKADLASLLQELDQPQAPTVPQRQFVKEWTVDEVVKLASAGGGGLKGRDFNDGRKLYAAAQCASCHRFNGEGGSVGPDLSALGGRFTVESLAEAIVAPDKAVSDQYRNTMFTLSDGQQVVGRIANLNGDHLMVVTNQLAPGNFTVIDRKQVVSQIDWPVSPMMPGLINTLNEEELKDLLAYLLSGGNRKHAAFR